MKSYDPMDMKHLPKLGSQPTRIRKGAWNLGKITYSDNDSASARMGINRNEVAKRLRKGRKQNENYREQLKRLKRNAPSNATIRDRYKILAEIQSSKADIAQSKQKQRQAGFNIFRAAGIVSPSGKRQHSKPIRYTGSK
jgi:23S rRNA G2069 N7-methylase RlmK/C1962 C5-methylase RlmI